MRRRLRGAVRGDVRLDPLTACLIIDAGNQVVADLLDSRICPGHSLIQIKGSVVQRLTGVSVDDPGMRRSIWFGATSKTHDRLRTIGETARGEHPFGDLMTVQPNRIEQKSSPGHIDADHQPVSMAMKKSPLVAKRRSPLVAR
ncbi:hypothetical protein GCM10023114_49670 [Mycolicibacterium sediminis]|uniref:Uncharacterized protein n=1 Tax=Mycolicibacterium sediminis TaxID=1286180 RepID=A0A7I7QMM0_9MYCO|nr:hypothetical protein MSEDJ_13760 [Mycolicibacterium sediminis]